MVSVWLIVIAVIAPILCLIFNYYILVYYQHPDDHNQAYLPKIIVVLGLTLAELSVLLIPFDVSNSSVEFGCGIWTTGCGGLSGLGIIWQVLFIVIAAFILIIIPCTILYYESYDYEHKTFISACSSAMFAQFTIIVVMVAICVGCYFGLNVTSLPVNNFGVLTTQTQSCAAVGGCTAGFIPQTTILSGAGQSINFNTPFLVFVPAFLGFVGWFLFCLYCGIGLVALPVDLIRAFVYRPKYMPKDVYIHSKLDIQKRVKELIDIGINLRKETELTDADEKYWDAVNPVNMFKKQKEGTLLNQFKRQVAELEEDFEDLKLCHENWNFFNPLIPFAKLIAGIFSVMLSIVWILQIILYNLARTPYGPDGVPTSYFLNEMFTWSTKQISFALLGVILIAIFGLYLLFCVMKGNEKFGLRFFIIEIHPMKYGGTYMNSFLVNVSLILLCCAPLVQFMASTLSEYVVLTDLDAIFGQQITFIRFFQYFYENNVFIIMMLSCAFVALVIMFWCPNDKRIAQSKAMTRKIEKYQESMRFATSQSNIQKNARQGSGVELNSSIAGSILEQNPPVQVAQV